MKVEIIRFLNDVNVFYVVLSLLFLVASLLFLKKKCVNDLIIEMVTIILVSVIWIGFMFFNDIFNDIFSFEFLSVKFYLVLLIIGNMIMLLTLNKRMKLEYKILNYMLFVSNVFIFFIVVCVVIFNKLGFNFIGTLEDASKLIGINYIIFIGYLVMILGVNIICNLFLLISDKVKFKRVNDFVKDNCLENGQDMVSDDYLGVKNEEVVATNEVVFNDNQDGFYIDGVDCSVIFEDDDKESVMANYYILLNDVEAKLTNGYTVSEYKRIKSIINKLNIKDLNNVNLDINKLSRITIDEYNLLKGFLNKRNKGF